MKKKIIILLIILGALTGSPPAYGAIAYYLDVNTDGYCGIVDVYPFAEVKAVKVYNPKVKRDDIVIVTMYYKDRSRKYGVNVADGHFSIYFDPIIPSRSSGGRGIKFSYLIVKTNRY